MSSSKTTTRTIRIANEVAEYFEKKPLNRAVESLYGLLTTKKISFDGEELKIECTHQNPEKIVPSEEKTEKTPIPKTSYESIDEMATLMRVPTDKLLDDIKDLLEEGTLYYSGNRLTNPRYEEFERLCELKKQDPDKMIMNVTRQMGG